VTGAQWAAASGILFGLFQSVNRRAVRDMDAYVSTFLQLAVAALVLAAASLTTQDLGRLGEATAWSLVAFALAGLVHFLAGWTFLNLSQKRIGAARTSPLLTLTPVFGLALAALTLGQLPSAVALAAIVPMIAGAYLVSSSGPAAGIRDARFGLACALMWALSPLLTVEGLDGLPSPLLGVTIGMLAAVIAYGALLAPRGRLRLRAVRRGALAVKLLAGVLVALATWWRWIALDDADVGVVLALNLVSVPIVLFLAPLLSGRQLEQVSGRVWGGAALVVAGSLALIGVA
jgi:drug/metabolite transporter (DMT)-like permease